MRTLEVYKHGLVVSNYNLEWWAIAVLDTELLQQSIEHYRILIHYCLPVVRVKSLGQWVKGRALDVLHKKIELVAVYITYKSARFGFDEVCLECVARVYPWSVAAAPILEHVEEILLVLKLLAVVVTKQLKHALLLLVGYYEHIEL